MCKVDVLVKLISVILLIGGGSGYARGDGVAYVTAGTEKGATRGVDGAAFATSVDRFSDENNQVTAGETIVTLDDSIALVSFPGYGIAVQLSPSSQLTIQGLPVLDNSDPVSLVLLTGRALVTADGSKDHAVIVAGNSPRGSAFVVTRNASLAISVDAGGVTFAVVRGTVQYVAGDVPTGTNLDTSGKLLGADGIVVAVGHHVTTPPGTPVPEVPEALAQLGQGTDLTEMVYEYGLDAVAGWVKKVEEGDITPVRTEESERVGVWPPGGLQPGSAFDQPRSNVVSTTPFVRNDPVRTQALNPVRALFGSGLPGSVVVATRLARTRFVGSVGGIRANPAAQLGIQLGSGRR